MTDKPINLRHKALDFLSRRDYSYLELFEKLKKYTEDTDEIKIILDEMVAQKFLNEERYIESFINSKSKKYGSLKVKYLLSNKVNDSSLVSKIYQEQNIDEKDRAKEIWLKKFAGKYPADQKEKAKQIRFMLNRGFSMDIILNIINKKIED